METIFVLGSNKSLSGYEFDLSGNLLHGLVPENLSQFDSMDFKLFIFRSVKFTLNLECKK